MAKVKFTGVTIKLGAAHDSVNVNDGERDITFDRAEMRKQGAHKAQGTLRRGVVEAFSEAQRRREAEKSRDQKRKQARRTKRARHDEVAEG